MHDSTELIGWLIAVTVLPPLAVSLISLYPVRRFAVALGLLDQPGGHSTHTNTTPLGGGIGIWLGIILTFALGTTVVAMARADAFSIEKWVPESLLPYLEGLWIRVGELWQLLAAATILFILGIMDDRRGVNPWWRLAVEFLVAGFVVYQLGFALTAFIGVQWLTRILSVIWIVGVINSFNMLDNMDGLSAGIAAIIAASMATVMLTTYDPGTNQPQILVAALLLIVLGSLLGFLWHNRPPARIFMGDGGSYLVGFLIAVSMLMATFSSQVTGSSTTQVQEIRPHAMLAPLCVMAVPLYDMATVLWIRIREKRSLFVGDHSHFSHRLVELGLSRVQAVLTIYLVTGTCGLASILLVHVGMIQAITVIGIVGCMLLLVIILESTGWQNNKR